MNLRAGQPNKSRMFLIARWKLKPLQILSKLNSAFHPALKYDSHLYLMYIEQQIMSSGLRGMRKSRLSTHCCNSSVSNRGLSVNAH